MSRLLSRLDQKWLQNVNINYPATRTVKGKMSGEFSWEEKRMAQRTTLKTKKRKWSKRKRIGYENFKKTMIY